MSPTICLAPAPFLALVVLAVAAPHSWAQQPGVVKIADGPAFTIIRGDKLFEASRGVKLSAGDFIETQPDSFVVADLPAGTVIACGPSTRLYLLADGASIVVLQGWLKLDAHPSSGDGTLHRALARQLGAASKRGVFVLHASDRRDEVFQESGVVTLLLRDDAVTRSNRESQITQYFTREDRNLRVAPRPEAAFVEHMPPQFRDPLPDGPVGGGNPKVVEPKLIRDVSYADIAEWLSMPRDWRTGFTSRFRGRLKDRTFFSAMDEHLSSHPEWTLILHPPPPPEDMNAAPDGRQPASSVPRRTEH